MAYNKIIESKYTKSFVSTDLGLVKYNKIKVIATNLLIYKNEIFSIVHSNLLFFMKMSKFDFITHFTNYYKSINGCIYKDNKKSQEEFECTKCGHKSNTDINVAINIKNRLTVLDGLVIATTKINDDSMNHRVNSTS